MGIWAWVQPVDRIWKVVSDNEKGKISVYNERDVLVFEQKGLSKEVISLIEREFLGVIATSLSENKSNAVKDNKKQAPEYNYMYT
ncbi:MAG: hypothetical protein OIN66_04930 [Candidatus Methanoperedens sp.]|nr:hypothetical protein [Candidatus Methanoperedens sp.]